MMKRWILIVVMSVSGLSLLADVIHGTIVDVNGEPMIGAAVQVQGTTDGTIADFDGNFEINCAKDALLEFSFMGYREQVLPASDNMQVVLVEATEELEEVVVVGYGSLSKKEVSSSIVQVDRESFNQGAVNDVMELVSGKIAGLNVSTVAAANPNSASSLQIRGATSLYASNEPLVVIDGVAGGDMRMLASQDVESITVLKDAASAAIYGTRGANGVILITTKKGSGEEGKVVATYDGYVAMNIALPHAEVLSPDEFRRSHRRSDYGASTDWYSLLTRPVGYTTNHYISVDSKTKNGYYGASINFKQGNGLDLKSGRREYGGRFSMEQYLLNRHLQLNASLTARKVDEKWGNDGLLEQALTMNPTVPVYNSDGSYYQPDSPTGASNPVNELLNIRNEGDRWYVMGNADLKWNIWHNEQHDVSTQVSYAIQYNDLKTNYYAPSTTAGSYWGGYKGDAHIEYQKYMTHSVEWLANYQMSLNDHTLKVMAGYSWERYTNEGMYEQNRDFDYDQLLWYGIGNGSWLKDGKANIWASKTENILIGFFGRVNYNWRNMLFVSASIRYEGCTKFGKNHKWGAFPSVSAAWEMMEADFMEPARSVVSSLKPRISYGVTGRSDFSPYKSSPSYISSGSMYMDGQWINGYMVASNANPDLRWERSSSFNVGIDYAFLNSSLRGYVEFFDRRSPDLLYNYNAPQPPYMYSTILVNVGTTKNIGVELSVEYDVFRKKNFSWTTGINYSYGTTRLMTISSDMYQAPYIELYQKPGVGSNEYFFRVEENQKLGQFYGYKYVGTLDGMMLVEDKNGNAIPVSQADASDKRYIGNGMPEHFLTWNNSFHFKGFDLSLQFGGAFDFNIFNMRRYGMGLQGCGTDNVLRSAYLKDAATTQGGGVISSFFLERGDYFKLDNITFGYTYSPKERKLLESLRVYVTAKNVFTLTRYSGNDPSIVPSTGLTPGVDISSAYPSATQLCVGLTVKIH